MRGDWVRKFSIGSKDGVVNEDISGYDVIRGFAKSNIRGWCPGERKEIKQVNKKVSSQGARRNEKGFGRGKKSR